MSCVDQVRVSYSVVSYQSLYRGTELLGDLGEIVAGLDRVLGGSRCGSTCGSSCCGRFSVRYGDLKFLTYEDQVRVSYVVDLYEFRYGGAVLLGDLCQVVACNDLINFVCHYFTSKQQK